ncbi:MAG: hypothetical protein ACIAXF_05515 [Phycisphaerales bacterium JB063]
MLDDDRYIFWTERRPRCLSCGSADLHPYKSMPAESDGSRLRYVVCKGCATRWKLVIEPEDNSFQPLENATPHSGE